MSGAALGAESPQTYCNSFKQRCPSAGNWSSPSRLTVAFPNVSFLKRPVRCAPFASISVQFSFIASVEHDTLCIDHERRCGPPWSDRRERAHVQHLCVCHETARVAYETPTSVPLFLLSARGREASRALDAEHGRRIDSEREVQVFLSDVRVRSVSLQSRDSSQVDAPLSHAASHCLTLWTIYSSPLLCLRASFPQLQVSQESSP